MPEDQRLTLANLILKLSEPRESDEIRRACDMAIRDRIARYDKGKTESRPASKVFAESLKIQ